jgi:hypothetical protein
MWCTDLGASPNRFNGNLVGVAKQDPFSESITALETRSRPYLVLRIAVYELVFYSVLWDSFVAVKSRDEVIPAQPKRHCDGAAVSDEQALSRIL